MDERTGAGGVPAPSQSKGSDMGEARRRPPMFWQWRHREPWPRGLKILFWVGIVLALVSTVLLPLALLALPVLLTAIVWWAVWFVGVRRRMSQG